MKKMKKAALIFGTGLCLAVGTGGTLAYLGDTGQVANRLKADICRGKRPGCSSYRAVLESTERITYCSRFFCCKRSSDNQYIRTEYE